MSGTIKTGIYIDGSSIGGNILLQTLRDSMNTIIDNNIVHKKNAFLQALYLPTPVLESLANTQITRNTKPAAITPMIGGLGVAGTVSMGNLCKGLI